MAAAEVSPPQRRLRRLRLFPDAPPSPSPPSAAAGAGAAVANLPPHNVRASLATVHALGGGAFAHVRIRPWPPPAEAEASPPPLSRFLPARLVPCPALSDEAEAVVLLAADEGVLATLGVAVGGRVAVEAAIPPDANATGAGVVTVAPVDGLPCLPTLPAAVLRRAARGLLLAPGALLLVPHLGLTYAVQVVEVTAAAGSAVVVVGPGTELRLRGGLREEQHKQHHRQQEEEEVEGAGVHDAVLEDAVALLRASSRAAADPAGALGPLRMRGLLLAGPRGVGKTRFLRRLVARLWQEGLRVAYARGEEVRRALGAEEEDGGGQAARRLAQQLWIGPEGQGEEAGGAVSPSPYVLVLDDADTVLLADDDMDDEGGDDDQGGASSLLSRHSAARALCRFLLQEPQHPQGQSVRGPPRPCCWVLATRGAVGQGGGSKALARRLAALQGAGLFDRTLELPPLSEAERVAVLRALLPRRRGRGPPESEAEAAALVARVAEATGGFVPGDLERLCRAAALLAVARASGPAESEGQEPEPEPEPRLAWADFAEARREVGPAALGGLLQASRVPQQAVGAGAVSWASVGGYEGVKARLRQLIEWPLRYAATFERMGLGAGSGRTPGILLHGPSGCGKSLLARVLAAEARANFVELPATEVFSPFLGDSEARLRAAFARARRASPCILFLDELDAMAAGREGMTADGGGGGGSSGGVYARVLSTLLNEMDGVSTEAGGGGLVVLAATNRVAAVDAALLRPGRLQEVLLVPLPDPETDYLPILQVATARTPLAADVDLAALVRDRLAPRAATGGGGITPATLGALAREAALVCLREAVEEDGEEGQRQLEVTARHFERAVEIVFGV